jgi:hypothetical protein
MRRMRRRLPLHNPGAQMLLFAAPEDYPAPGPPDPLAVAEGEPYSEEPEPSCVRSPCASMKDVWDPKVSQVEIAAARLEVGTPKPRRGMVTLALEPTGKYYKSGERKGEEKTRPVPVWQDTEGYYRPGEPDWPLAVSYGIGIDSTAILVGLAQILRETGDERFRPRWITFADTGAEKASTYAYLRLLNRWCDKVGFPRVTTVAWAQFGGGDSWGSHRTLEQKCLNNQTLPSISASKFKRSECSVTWKHDPQDRWFRDHSGYFEPSLSHNCTSKALASLAGGMSLSVKDVARSSQCSQATARGVLKALIEHSPPLVYRVKEGRSFLYTITEAGEAARVNGRLMDAKMVMPAGMRIVKAIGYDSTEEARLDPNAEGSTFRAGDGDDPQAHDYSYWYPLMEWDWERSRCYAEIEAELAPVWREMVAAGELDPALLPGPVPGKSSCFFCGAMKPEEIRYLSKEDLSRAILMELVSERGRHPSTVKGLAVNWAWADFAAGKVTKGMPDRAKEQVREFGALLSESELRALSDQANEWLAASPSAKGEFDVAEVGHSMGLLAFTRMRGLRGDPGQLGWDLYEEKRGKALTNPPLPYDPLLEGSG